MADNRKYYYLKLKESFFDGDSIVLLESMPDGILFSNILMKLYLKSLKNGGKLQLDEHIPYTAQMIATLTRHQIGTVERAIKVFLQLGLVEQLDGGLLYMTDIELMIGQSSTEGERKRAARRENRALLPQRTNGGHLSDIRPPEIEKEIEIELEKEREREEGRPAPAVYGKYQNVFLTDTELAELKEEIPDKWAYYIDRLSGYIASTGKKYQNHAPPSCAGRRTMPRRLPRSRAYRTTPTRRERAYEKRIGSCFYETDDGHAGTGGLHRRGRAAVLRQVPYPEGSLPHGGNEGIDRA